jgi:type II secretory pathway component PulF
MKIALKSIARFTRQMATYQDSFVDIRRALASLADGARDSRLSGSLRRVAERVNEGASLYEAFEAEGNRYPQIFLRMTKIGEASGTLAQIYRTLADYLEQQVAMKRRFIGRLIYPGFMLFMMMVVHSILTGVFAGVGGQSTNWSQIERVMARQFAIDISLAVGAVLAVFALRYALAGRSLTDAFVLYMPPLRGAFRKLVMARFSLSMYLMTGSAIGLPEAVEESGKATGNWYFAHRCAKAARCIEEGEPLTPVLDDIDIFPRDFIDIVEVAEESGTLSESMRRVAPHYAEDAEMSMNRLVTGLAWALYLGMMAVMGFYIITLYAKYISGLQGLMQ